MYSNESMTWTMTINSPSNTVCSSRVFQQPTLLILTDVCKQSAAQPVQLSSTSQINTDARQLSCRPFPPCFSSFTTDLLPIFHQRTEFVWRGKFGYEHCDGFTPLRKTIQDLIMLTKKVEESRKQYLIEVTLKVPYVKTLIKPICYRNHF